ncbi:MAG TPA: aminotransferase class I/II-fold pyridoxal phosphate-dependent enzyme [Jatrophihabitantaceae bacterium]|nr:aminotransferase class I/II-fold pyridoxal phosphate-dependent enzyme [Jatrophihabitantaceae bacterium]
MDDLPRHPDTVAVAAGRPDAPGSPLSQPIVLSATFRSGEAGNDYLRNASSDTVRALETAIGALEGGIAIAFASGMAAASAVVHSRPVGTTAVVPQAAYSGAVTLFDEEERFGRMAVRRVDSTDTAAVLAALPGAKLLWLESMTNPLMGVPDLPVLVEAANAQGALSCVDATFSTPRNLCALDLGADVVMHSATKFLSGHSDVLMGALVTRSEELAAELLERRRIGGAMPGALECFLALRGLRTFGVRMERAEANAAELARRLDAHPSVTRVRYPGLPSDPGHERASKFQSGYGAMISFEVAGTADDADRVCERVRLITHATSLGGVESLIERRAQYEVDASYGTPPTLLRFSVGIEHVEDLCRDLEQALGSR